MFRTKKILPAVFLDLARAFDKVWHEGLTYKIKRMLPVNTHNILQSYLKNRKFRVKYNEYVTRDYDIMAGVPQGSVLGPTLYLIFTADLPTSDRVLTCTFAHDTAILSSHCNPVIASSELNCHLKHLEIWYNNWRIRINELKSKYVTFTLRKADCPPVYLETH